MTDPVRIQRLEAAAMAIAIYAVHLAAGLAWWWPLALFLVIDLAALGYLAGPRVGARIYNAVHAWVGPAIVAVLAVTLDSDASLIAATVWGFHVAVDRALGYGLKLPDAFGHTHLGRIGREQ